ncbi:transposase [Chamaesiphon sp. VAR_48_metabat_135_sub]|uniref:transposase n=1 Tax=Chamaesiphon sp. VAR_48_metabat_135_sub TaxID=2964699 RepID=UPI00286C0E68|nr:transposase [Chamaesiphon sp. VAR_48_metabat_135_sub]
MNYNPELHHRRSIRLKGYDYSTAGAYFITICTHEREQLFGDIVDLTMVLNELGNITQLHWQKLARYHPNLIVDRSVVMPNHLHGIILLNLSILHGKGYTKEDSKSISEIIGSFKTFSARTINKIRRLKGVPVWQRNYYERIIRTETELDCVRQYIIDNPINWQTDVNHKIR